MLQSSSNPLRAFSSCAPSRRRTRRDFYTCKVVAADDQFSTFEASTNGQSASSSEQAVTTAFIAETLLPTRYGKYRLRGYKHTADGGQTWTEPTAIVYGRPEGCASVPVRVHDACFTSEVLGSLKCDCAEQLQLALRYIKDHSGVVIYLQQEGRGIGLANKIAAYALQEKGYDTVDANRMLGLPDDAREYTAVANILAQMGIQSIRLITNNPRKIKLLSEAGVTVVDRIPCLVQPGEFSKDYLDVKGRRMDHMLQLDGDFCYWDHSGELEPPHTPKPVDSLDSL